MKSSDGFAMLIILSRAKISTKNFTQISVMARVSTKKFSD